MKLLFVLSLALTSISAANLSFRGFPETRIINGHDADRGEATFIVSLQRKNSHFCGGSIIHKQWVLTAAHCLLYSHSFVEFQVVAGLYRLDDRTGVQVRNVRKEDHQLPHESYSEAGLYDIALVYIKDPFNLGDSARDGTISVSKINLPQDDYDPTGKAKVYGWGKLASGGYPDILQALEVNLMGYTECKNHFPGDPVESYNVCSYTDNTSDGTCNRDSGGPLVKTTSGNPELIGVVSWSERPCNDRNHPTVYMKTSNFVEWIRKELENFNTDDEYF